MGGTSTQQQQSNQTQNTSGTSTTNPWAAATPFLQSVLGSATGQLQNVPLNALQNQGIAGLNAQAQQGNPYAQSIGQYATNLLGGGNALQQNPLFTSTLGNLQQTLSPYTQSNYLDPNSNPYLAPTISGLTNDITGQINSEFAGAGRSLSDSNTQALARGLSQGLSPVLMGQYNTNVGNQLGAANTLYGAGNTTAGLLNQAQQTYLGNQGQGVNAATSALSAAQQPYQQMLNLGQLQTGLPLQTLQALSSIGVPIAGLGGTTQQQGTTTGTGSIDQSNTLSGAQQAWGWMNAFGNLFRGGGGGTPGGTGASSVSY